MNGYVSGQILCVSCQFAKLPQSLPMANPAPSRREPALSVAARHLSRRERQVWTVRKTKAFLPEEGGTAQAVTEGAARGQVCIRANPMRILSICKTPSVFACGKSSSLKEGASPFCRCATSLPRGETRLWVGNGCSRLIVFTQDRNAAMRVRFAHR